MIQRRERYTAAQLIFGVLFILSACLLLVFLLFVRSEDGKPPDSSGPSISDGDSSSLVGIISLLTSLASLIGFVSTSVLKWREEQRETRAAELERQRQQLEIERLRLELERLKAKPENEG